MIRKIQLFQTLMRKTRDFHFSYCSPLPYTRQDSLSQTVGSRSGAPSGLSSVCFERPVMTDVEAYQNACDLAASLAQHVFDTLYHAVALYESGALSVTADERYYRAAHRIGRIVKLKDFVLSAI